MLDKGRQNTLEVLKTLRVATVFIVDPCNYDESFKGVLVANQGTLVEDQQDLHVVFDPVAVCPFIFPTQVAESIKNANRYSMAAIVESPVCDQKFLIESNSFDVISMRFVEGQNDLSVFDEQLIVDLARSLNGTEQSEIVIFRSLES